VTSLSQLAELEAHHNRLKCVEIYDVHNLLTRLDLSNNALCSFPSVGSSIQEMFLSHNLITFLPSSSTTLFYNIHTLDLSDNSLEELPSDFTSFTALCRLYLANNYLNTVPLGLAALINLTTLTLHGNPLFSLPTLQRFVSSNTQRTDTGKVLNYLRLLKQNSSPIGE
jgi:Leucine-rich repeat (LRR) protein